MEFSKYNNRLSENENEFISSFADRVNDVLENMGYEDYDEDDEYSDSNLYLSEYSLENYLTGFRPSKHHLANSKLFRGETTVNLTLDEKSDLGLQSMIEVMLAERPYSSAGSLMEWLLARGYQQCILNRPINLTMEDLLENQSRTYAGTWHSFVDALEVLEIETRPSNDKYRDLPRQLFNNISDSRTSSIVQLTHELYRGFREMNRALRASDWQEHSMEEFSSHFDEHKHWIALLNTAIACKNVQYSPFAFHNNYVVSLRSNSLKIDKGRDILPTQEWSQEEFCEMLSLSILYTLANLTVHKNLISIVLPDIETHITDEEEVYKRIEEFSTALNRDLDTIYDLVSNDRIDTEDFVLKIFNETMDCYKSVLVELYVTNPQGYQNSPLVNELLEPAWTYTISSDTAMKFALNPFGEVSYDHHKQDESEIDSRTLKQFNQLPKFGKQLKFIIRKSKEQWKKVTPRSFAYQKGFNTFSFYEIIKKYPELKQPLDEMVLTNKDMYGYLDTPLTNYLVDEIYGDYVEKFKSQFTETFWNDLYARVAPKLEYKTEIGSEPVTISLEQKDILTASFSGYSWTSCHAGSYLQSPFALAVNEVTFVAYGSGGRDTNHLNGTVDKKRYRAYCHYAEVGDDFLLSVEGIYPQKSPGLTKLIYKALCERMGVNFDDLVRVEFPVFGQPGYEILEKIILSGYYDYYENNIATYMTKNLYDQLKSKAMELLGGLVLLEELDDFYDKLLLACDSDYSAELTRIVGCLDRQDIYKGIQLVLLQEEICKTAAYDLLPVLDNKYGLQRYWDTVAKILSEHSQLENNAIAYYLYTNNLSDFGSPIDLSITQHSTAAHDLLGLPDSDYNDNLYDYNFYPNPWGESYRELFSIE